MALFNECYPQITSMLFQSLIKEKVRCTKCQSEANPDFTYVRSSTFQLELDDFLGNALDQYFGDSEETRDCKVCGEVTCHEIKERSALVLPSIMSFSVPRFDVVTRQNKSLHYPDKIEFMDQYSTDFMPSYELIAVIVNRGDEIHTNKLSNKVDKNHYVTIVKRENGDVIEFDPQADGPKKLSNPKAMLNETRNVEMLFYKEFDPSQDESNIES